MKRRRVYRTGGFCLGRSRQTLVNSRLPTLAGRVELERCMKAPSAARSIAMLRILKERYDVQPGRMSVVGFADTDATEPDTTPEARARNRRVDVVVLTPSGVQADSR
jgi:hypothetical protein